MDSPDDFIPAVPCNCRITSIQKFLLAAVSQVQVDGQSRERLGPAVDRVGSSFGCSLLIFFHPIDGPESDKPVLRMLQYGWSWEDRATAEERPERLRMTVDRAENGFCRSLPISCYRSMTW